MDQSRSQAFMSYGRSHWLLAALVLAVTGLFGMCKDGWAQALGGCASGSEIGYVQVTSQAPILEYGRSAQFAVGETGDEFRLCRLTDDWVVVTLIQRGVGFRIARSAVVVQDSLSSRPLPLEQRSCIAQEIGAIQSRTRGVDAQSRALLTYARSVGLTLPHLMVIRTQAIRGELGSCSQ